MDVDPNCTHNRILNITITITNHINTNRRIRICIRSRIVTLHHVGIGGRRRINVRLSDCICIRMRANMDMRDSIRIMLCGCVRNSSRIRWRATIIRRNRSRVNMTIIITCVRSCPV